MTFSYRGSPCPPTCDNPDGTVEDCPFPFLETCQCDRGTVLDGMRCVNVTDCGCQVEGGRYLSVRRSFDCCFFLPCHSLYLQTTPSFGIQSYCRLLLVAYYLKARSIKLYKVIPKFGLEKNLGTHNLQPTPIKTKVLSLVPSFVQTPIVPLFSEIIKFNDSHDS